MKVTRGIFQYLMSLAGASIFYVLIIALISLIVTDDVNQFKSAVWFIGVLLIFYGFIASLIWELFFHLINFKTWWRGGVFYLLLGAICGGIAIAIVHYNLGETDVWGMIGSLIIMGVAAFVFYAIRRIPY